MSYRLAALLCSLLVVLAACSDDPPTNKGSSNNNGTANNGATNNGAANNGASNNGATNNGTTNNGASNNGATNNGEPLPLTYHAVIRPILERNCTQCHYAGGIGPFPLTTYEEVGPLALLLKGVTGIGQMPPWPPAQGCGEFKHERVLSEEEIAAIAEWAENEAPEGDPADYAAPENPARVDLGAPDYVVDIGTDYVPNPRGNRIDDYHCFAIDPQLSEDVFLNAIETVPGNLGTVHHMLFWAVPKAERAARVQELENEDPSTPGWNCFGGNRVGGIEAEIGLLGGWVPGTTPIQYDEGVGIRLQKDHLIVVQIHYNTLNNTDPDRTKINLHFVEGTPKTVLQMLPLPAMDLKIAAGDANAVWTMEVPYPLPRVQVYGVVPHMHTLGTGIKVWYSKGGEDHCLIDIPDWDFNWQGFYFYKEPVEVPLNAKIRMECRYDNSAGNQPDGQTPRDVEWGEGTYDEMCLNYFIIEELFAP
jgi:mono/diheme cytochrome c family protein